jgi:hypothetical protein
MRADDEADPGLAAAIDADPQIEICRWDVYRDVFPVMLKVP